MVAKSGNKTRIWHRIRRATLRGTALIGLSLFSHIAARADGQTALATFVHDRAALIRQFPDATIDAASGGCLTVTPAAFAPPTPATDPNYSWHFSRTAYVYAPRRIDGDYGYLRVVSVHYEPEERDQARRSACLIGRLWSEYREHFGRDILFPLLADSADVYLAPDKPKGGSDLGGRTRNTCIYVFGAGVDARTPLEWVRTIAHEWGHLTLAAARGYRDPEEDASGYLGERLYLKWLHADESKRPASAPDDGTTTADLDLYYNRQIAPLSARFQESGPASPLLDGGDTQAMDYYIGSVLASDDAFGSQLTGRALYTVLDDKARDFLVALRTELADKPVITVQTPAWVPLKKGRYHVASADAPHSPEAPTLKVVENGWQHLTGGPLRLSRIGATP